MATFAINVTKRITLAGIGLSNQQMTSLGMSTIDAMRARWARGLDSEDRPAAPLSTKYARRKQRLGSNPIPDLHLTGLLWASMTVLRAEPGRVVIGPSDSLSITKAISANRRRNQFGISNNDARIVSPLAARMIRDNVASVFTRAA